MINTLKRVIFLVLISLSFSAPNIAQDHPHDISDICCRINGPDSARPNPSEETILSGGASACTYSSIDQFAALSLNELIDYLIQEFSPLSCIYTTLFSFHNEYSSVVFSEANVKYVADTAIPLASTYNGESDNGIYSLMTFLNIAAQMALYYSDDIAYSENTWNSIRSACSILSVNPNINNSSNISIRVTAELIGTASARQVNDDLNVMAFAGDMLENINSATYNSSVDIYLYYYAYYYLLDVYFRFAPQNDVYISNLNIEPSIISKLSALSINTDINTDTYQYFGQLSTLSIDALSNHSGNTQIDEEINNALLAVTEAYPPYTSNWVKASLEVIDRDVPFELEKEEIIQNIMDDILPYTYSFDDGKFLVTTPLSYSEALSLYEAAQQVKAQFFRLMHSDIPVADDLNDTLKIKIYGTRSDYQNYNDMLFAVNYPNSGGVYIETHGTFYTYQRTAQESPYSLEALFRHEYTHYLQGRYLIPGEWGTSPYYDNSRLVWFEEGMAQFLAGSTIHDGVKGLEVFRNVVSSDISPPSLEQIFSSNYASGNPNAYYVYSPMLWLRWYRTNLELIKLLFFHISNGNLDAFDNLVANFGASPIENDLYNSFVGYAALDDDFWINPNTEGLPVDDITYKNLESITSDITNTYAGIVVESSYVEYDDPTRYHIEGKLTLTENYSAIQSAARLLQDKLDEILKSLTEDHSANIYDHSVAYFTDIVRDDQLSTTFHIIGPYREGSCDQIALSDFTAEVYDDYASLKPASNFIDKHQFRYRAVGSNAWINLIESAESSDIVRFLNSPVGYEYSMRFFCNGEWTAYSANKTFSLCPETREIGQLNLDIDNIYKADIYVLSEATIMQNTSIGMQAGSSVELLPQFEVKLGGLLDVQMQSCRHQ